MNLSLSAGCFLPLSARMRNVTLTVTDLGGVVIETGLSQVTVRIDAPSDYAGTYVVSMPETADQVVSVVPPAIIGSALFGESLRYRPGLWLVASDLEFVQHAEWLVNGENHGDGASPLTVTRDMAALDIAVCEHFTIGDQTHTLDSQPINIPPLPLPLQQDAQALMWLHPQSRHADTDGVTRWYDLSGAGLTLERHPLHPAPVVDAQGGVSFTGQEALGCSVTGDGLTHTLVSGGHLSLFSVIAPQSSATDSAVVSNLLITEATMAGGQGQLNLGLRANQDMTSGYFYSLTGGPDGWAFNLSSDVVSDPYIAGLLTGQKVLFELNIDNTTASLRLNGRTVASSEIVADRIVDVTGFLTLGGFLRGKDDSTLGGPFSGDVFEIFATGVSDSAHHDTVRQALAQTHGINLA